MKILRWLLLSLLIGLAMVRAVGYLAYAVTSLPSPFEVYYLEAKMVLLAYRAELGLDFYPAWQNYPHVTNFYGPIYFGLVGLVGRALRADIPGLFRIGRLVSFVAGILTSMLVGVIAARRYGRTAGVAGSILSLAVTPMTGFSVMTRPDMVAEFLGTAGFFLAGGRRGWTQILGGVVLVVAMLTKQTTAIFLIAAAMAWIVEGQWRRGCLLGFGTAAALGVVVGGVTLMIEPSFAGALLGEGKAPWDLGSWVTTVSRVAPMSPDLLFFPAVGFVLWSWGATGRREAQPAALAAVLLVTSLVTSAKLGSDINYFLNLRVVEVLAVGALWQAWAISTSRLRSAVLMVVAVLGCAAVIPGAGSNIITAENEVKKARSLTAPYGRAVLAFHRRLYALAADPESRLLTDSGMIELYEGGRAAFGDPFLFRVMVNTGRINPTLIRDRIDSGYYQLIITTKDIDSPTYDTGDFGLPKMLTDRVRARYLRLDAQAGLFLYEPRPAGKQ